MATIPLKDITFPGLDNTYTIPEIDNTLSTAGKAADAKKTGDEIDQLKSELTQVSDIISIGGNLIPYAVEKINANNNYKDSIRTIEMLSRGFNK